MNSKATKSRNHRPRESIVREAITLATARGRLCVFIPVLLLLAALPVSWLQRTLPQLSVCNYLLGDWCFSVGITRGVSSLLKGQFIQAWQYNPLSYGAAGVMLAIVAVDIWRLLARPELRGIKTPRN